LHVQRANSSPVALLIVLPPTASTGDLAEGSSLTHPLPIHPVNNDGQSLARPNDCQRAVVVQRDAWIMYFVRVEASIQRPFVLLCGPDDEALLQIFAVIRPKAQIQWKRRRHVLWRGIELGYKVRREQGVSLYIG